MANLYSSYEISRWLRKYSKLLNMADSSSETDFRSSLAFLNISLYYSTLDSFSSNGYKTRVSGIGGYGIIKRQNCCAYGADIELLHEFQDRPRW